MIAGLSLLVLAVAVAGCNSGNGVRPGNGGGGGEEDPFPPSTRVGEPVMPGIVVKQVNQPASTGDTGSFTIENTAARDLKYLTGTILYFFKPAKPGGIAKTDSEAHLQGFDIFKGETITLKATYESTQPLERMMLRVEQRATEPGVTFLDRTLECVSVVNDLSRIRKEDRRLAFTVRNRSKTALESVKYKVVLLYRNGETVESRWASVGVESIAPGQTLSLEPKFRGEVSGYPIAILQVKQAG
jgi:hypothetical protein